MPLLCKAVSRSLGPADAQTQEAWFFLTSGSKMDTLTTLYASFTSTPSLCMHVRILRLGIAIPALAYVDESFAVDPRHLVATLSLLPHLRDLKLQDVFLSRPLKPEEVGCGPKELDTLTLDFPIRAADRCDVLAILDLFEVVSTITLLHIDDRRSRRSARPPGQLRSKLRCRHLVLDKVLPFPDLVLTFMEPAFTDLQSVRVRDTGSSTLDQVISTLGPSNLDLRLLSLSLCSATIMRNPGAFMSVAARTSTSC